jgi:hypothetical protein
MVCLQCRSSSVWFGNRCLAAEALSSACKWIGGRVIPFASRAPGQEARASARHLVGCRRVSIEKAAAPPSVEPEQQQEAE